MNKTLKQLHIETYLRNALAAANDFNASSEMLRHLSGRLGKINSLKPSDLATTEVRISSFGLIDFSDFDRKLGLDFTQKRAPDPLAQHQPAASYFAARCVQEKTEDIAPVATKKPAHPLMGRNIVSQAELTMLLGQNIHG